MRLEYKKSALGLTWLCAILTAGLLGQATWPSWLVLAALALIPTTVMWRLWAPPSETISESIQNARR